MKPRTHSWYLILALLLLAGAVGVTIRNVLRDGSAEEGAEVGIKVAFSEEIRQTGMKSSVAREHLLQVILGVRPAPSYERRLARRQYWDDTEEWLQALNTGDCVSLIALNEQRGTYVLLDRLYTRYGELDPHGALASLHAEPSQYNRHTTNKERIVDALTGWAKHSPVEAWSFYERWYEVEQPNLLGSNSILFKVFEQWCRRDGDTCFEKMLMLTPDEFEWAIIGYMAGLDEGCDFCFASDGIGQ